MIDFEPFTVYGATVITLIILLYVIQRLVSLTVRVAAAALLIGGATGIIDPEIRHAVTTWLTHHATNPPTELPVGVPAVPGVKSIQLDLWWTHLEAWQAFGLHAVLGFTGIFIVYKLMEWRYPAAVIAGFAWVIGVVQLDRYLVHEVLHWQPWTQIFVESLYASGTGFAAGVLLTVVLLEPSFQNPPTSQPDLDDHI
jgi:hypothetical protein